MEEIDSRFPPFLDVHLRRPESKATVGTDDPDLACEVPDPPFDHSLLSLHSDDRWDNGDEPFEDTLSYYCQILAQLFACASRWRDVFFDVTRFGGHAQEWSAVAALGITATGHFILPPDFSFSAPHLRTLVVWPGLNSFNLILIGSLVQSSTVMERIDLQDHWDCQDLLNGNHIIL